MNIQLNGEPHEVEEETSVGGLLQKLDIRLDQVAVEINLEIMDKRDFETRILKDHDRVEVMSFIGGGSIDPVPLINVWAGL
ncbi:MAG: sulfur carrier protein ThiS [Nitrospirae bacterium]|nr:sulfur carrier protein ThiS [Nitrospirota bacterium]MDA1303962.1 sulfur carrier protein ThiS [Nitrospirota bacterium]